MLPSMPDLHYPNPITVSPQKRNINSPHLNEAPSLVQLPCGADERDTATVFFNETPRNATIGILQVRSRTREDVRSLQT